MIFVNTRYLSSVINTTTGAGTTQVLAIKISYQDALPDREWLYLYALHRARLSYTKRFNIIGIMRSDVEDYPQATPIIERIISIPKWNEGDVKDSLQEWDVAALNTTQSVGTLARQNNQER